MAIKNFLCFFVVSFLVACTSSPKKDAPTVPPSNAPVEVKKEHPAEAFMPPKFGLILGPGGMKTFAHIGVLKEFEKAGLPIHAVVGMEWGALVGALYADKGKANNVEWQMLKLKDDVLPKKKLFGSFEPRKIAAMNGFLDDVFGSGRRSPALPFSCPFVGKEGSAGWFDPVEESEDLKKVVKSCLPYGPLFETSESSAVPVDIANAAKVLKDMGADTIVLVNVLAGGKVYSGKDAAIQARWEQIKAELAKETNDLDFVIGVHTRDYDITNYEARRSQILFGSQAGAIAVRKLSDKYGLR